MKPPTGAGSGTAALASSAAFSAGDTCTGGGVAGQVPDTGASARQAIGAPGRRSASASATTTGIVVGLALR